MAMRPIFSLASVSTVLLLWPSLGFGAPQQNSSRRATEKQTLTLTGTVSEKGALLVCAADEKLYHVLNSETLKHLEGQLVTLKARFLEEKGQLYVTAVRAESTVLPVTFHVDDAAFRR